MEQTFESLTHGAVNGYTQSSISLCNSQTLAAELFLWNIVKEKHRSRLHLFTQKRA
jgi:hypothetical protein